MAIVTQTSTNCSCAKTSKQQLKAHTSIVRVKHNKVLQTHVSFLKMHTSICIGVINPINSITQNINQIYYLQNNIQQKHSIMARSSRTKSSISIDLFNLPPLPDTRKQSTMICKIPNDFFLPDGKNTQLSKVVNTWTFNRLTPNGNEGVGVKLDYLEHAYGTRYYIIDKVSSDINAIHDESLELTEFKGRFSPFDLDNLEAKVCRLALGNRDEEDIAEPQNAPQICFTNPRMLNMEEYEGMGFDENNYSPNTTS